MHIYTKMSGDILNDQVSTILEKESIKKMLI